MISNDSKHIKSWKYTTKKFKLFVKQLPQPTLKNTCVFVEIAIICFSLSNYLLFSENTSHTLVTIEFLFIFIVIA